MGRTLELVARLTMAGLIAAALFVLPGPATGSADARSPGCPSATSQRPPKLGSSTCYGRRILTFRAYVQRPCTDGCGGTTAYAIAPRWLDSMTGSFVELGTGPRSDSISAFVPPSLGRCSAFANLRSCPFRPGRWAIVTARFDAPVARTCRYSDHPPGPGFSKKDAIADCSADLVVMSIAPAAPETDIVAAAVKDPALGRSGPPLLLIFVGVLLLAAHWFPRRGRRVEPRLARAGWKRPR